MKDSELLVSNTYVLDEEETQNSYGEIATGDPGELVVANRFDESVMSREKVIVPRMYIGESHEEYNSKYLPEGHNLVRMECKKLHDDAKLPYRKRITDAAYDIFAYEDKVLPPKRLTKISTGIALACPPGFYFTIEGRSGLGMKEIVPFRGIIDATYTGELLIGLINHSDAEYSIKKFDRIAQVIVQRQLDMEIVVIDKFSSNYDQRGEAGFGSSGR